MPSSKANRLAMPIVATFAAASLIAPSAAFAAELNITQTSQAGENPPSHIVVKEKDGGIVKEIDYAGGTASIDPVQVEVGKSYVISATANGVVFQSQGGTISQDASYNVSLVATKATDVVIRFQAPGVTDYTGIKVSLYSGKDTTGTPKATASTDASGKVTITSVPSGEYTIKTDIPASLANAGLPATQSLMVPADGSPVDVVIAPSNTDAAKAQSDATAAASTNTPKDNEVSGATGTTDAMSQTSDVVAGGLIGFSATALAAAGAVAIARKKRNSK